MDIIITAPYGGDLVFSHNSGALAVSMWSEDINSHYSFELTRENVAEIWAAAQTLLTVMPEDDPIEYAGITRDMATDLLSDTPEAEDDYQPVLPPKGRLKKVARPLQEPPSMTLAEAMAKGMVTDSSDPVVEDTRMAGEVRVK